MKKYFLVSLLFLSTGIFAQNTYQTIGKIVVLDPALNDLIDPNAQLEIVAEGFTWSEGPVWVDKLQSLLFTDVPENIIYQWNEKDGLSTFLKPAGYTGDNYYSGEPGANGLIINSKGNLISCEHGDRRIAEMPLNKPNKKKTLAHLYQGKQLNSPNDLIQTQTGDYFFTDPPYGLPKRGEPEAAKELDFQGVYRITKKGELILQYNKMTRPNGIAITPDQKTVIVAQSDPKAIIWNAFPIMEDGNLGEPTLFFNGMDLVKQGFRGSGDGLKIDKKGTIWATGPGGILIISKEGKLLGRIETNNANSNVAFGGENRQYLFITSDMNLLRLKIK